MFSLPTMIVVGAGASKEYNLPLGSELRSCIASLLDIHYDRFGRYPEKGDEIIAEAFKIVSASAEENINNYIGEARNIARAMPLATSIDTFLDAHNENGRAVWTGKVAIVQAILKAERRSSLFYKPSMQQEFNVEVNCDLWIAGLCRVITEGISRNNLGELGNNLSLVSFNYDRCIKFYMYHHFQKFYGLSDQEAARAVASIPIYHPYGSVGSLPFEGQPLKIPFGMEARAEHLIEIAKGIKTYTERNDDIACLSDIRQRVSNVDRLVFLGFGFHKQNMEILFPSALMRSASVIATGLGISRFDQKTIERDLRRKFRGDYTEVNFLEKSASSVFDDFAKTLAN